MVNIAIGLQWWEDSRAVPHKKIVEHLGKVHPQINWQRRFATTLRQFHWQFLFNQVRESIAQDFVKVSQPRTKKVAICRYLK